MRVQKRRENCPNDKSVQGLIGIDFNGWKNLADK